MRGEERRVPRKFYPPYPFSTSHVHDDSPADMDWTRLESAVLVSSVRWAFLNSSLKNICIYVERRLMLSEIESDKNSEITFEWCEVHCRANKDPVRLLTRTYDLVLRCALHWASSPSDSPSPYPSDSAAPSDSLSDSLSPSNSPSSSDSPVR